MNKADEPPPSGWMWWSRMRSSSGPQFNWRHGYILFRLVVATWRRILSIDMVTVFRITLNFGESGDKRTLWSPIICDPAPVYHFSPHKDVSCPNSQQDVANKIIKRSVPRTTIEFLGSHSLSANQTVVEPPFRFPPYDNRVQSRLSVFA